MFTVNFEWYDGTIGSMRVCTLDEAVNTARHCLLNGMILGVKIVKEST